MIPFVCFNVICVWTLYITFHLFSEGFLFFRSYDSFRLVLRVTNILSHNFSAYLTTWWESPTKIMCTIRLCELQTKSLWSSQTILKSILPQTMFDSWIFFVWRAKLVPPHLKKKNDSFNVTVITVVTEWLLTKKREECVYNDMNFF